MALIIKGRVVSGRGVGHQFIRLEWVNRQILEKFGFNPYVGTLNLKMDIKNCLNFQSFTNSRPGIPISSGDGAFYKGRCFRIRIKDIDGIIVIPLVSKYPRDQIEIVAPVNLRKSFGLRDGDLVTVNLGNP